MTAVEQTDNETFCIIWLDDNPKETRDTEQKLRAIINRFKKYPDVKSCQNFLEKLSSTDRVVMIASGRLGQEIVPTISRCRQIIAIYIYCYDIKKNKEWADKFSKVKAVVNKLDELISCIESDHKIQKVVEEPIALTYFNTEPGAGNATKGLNGDFIYSQVLIDCLLRLKYTEEDKKELIRFCNDKYKGNSIELEYIRDFAEKYSSEGALQWYTKQCFCYKTLNEALRKQDIHLIFLFRELISDIYRQLQSEQTKSSQKVYRCQMMSTDELKNLKQLRGQFISVNSFFSTSMNYKKAIPFLNVSDDNSNVEPVLFEIDVDPSVVISRPFADISKYSKYPEAEILFAPGSIFRLKAINRSGDGQVWIIRMGLCGDDDHDLKQVILDMKEQRVGTGNANLQILGRLLWDMRKFNLAEKYFLRMVDQKQIDDSVRIELYQDLSKLAYQTGNSDKGMEWLKIASALKNKDESPNIGGKGCNDDLFSISSIGFGPLFSYTKLFKEALLQIEDTDDESIKELMLYCRQRGDIKKDEIKSIEKEYHRYSPIWWYTSSTFLYSIVNQSLRLFDVKVILKVGFFIRQLHRQLEQVYHQQLGASFRKDKFMVYRGQKSSGEALQGFQRVLGGFISFTDFLSTSPDRKLSLSFATRGGYADTNIGILFEMTIDPKLPTPFVEITDDLGFYGDQEKEVLFSTHTVFRVEKIQKIPDSKTDRLWQVNLTLVDGKDHDVTQLEDRLRDELGEKTGWDRLGDLCFKIGKFENAQEIYQNLLQKSSSNKDQANFNAQLGTVFKNKGEYKKSLHYYEQALDIRQKYLQQNDPDMTNLYHNIGVLSNSMGEYSKSLHYYEQALDIRQKCLPPNHPELAVSYSNIGALYNSTGQYPKALELLGKALKIGEMSMPPTHPMLASIYDVIGSVYSNMGEYKKSLSFHEKAHQIYKKCLPPNHPDLAISYHNMGHVYLYMDDHSESLSYFEKALNIRKESLAPNHPDLAVSYNDVSK